MVSPEEWAIADKHQINYEFDPGDNIPSANLTDVYLTYDEQHLLIGFIAYADMSTLRSSIRNRDAAWQDDMV
ncbi:MAG: Carbohydrate family 9 binding domain-like, partial [Bacteroidota bacterium]